MKRDPSVAVAVRPLRVAMVTDTYHPSANGVVRSVETTAHALRALGVDVTLFAPGTRRAPAEPGVRWVMAFESRVYPQLHLPVAPLLPTRLRRFDVLHVHTPGALGLAALVAARALGRPCVYTYHTRFEELLHFVSSSALAERGSEEVNRQVLRAASAVIAPTDAIARELRAQFEIASEVIPTGVDARFFAPHAAKGPPRFLHLGRVSPEKGLDAVLRAFPLVLRERPDARLDVAGSGPDLAGCQALARELGLAGAVRFLGFVPDEQVPATYASADVFVTASRFETQGLTVLEAMAGGCAVALADCDVFRPFVDAGAAVPFDPARPGDVARALLDALDRRDALRERGLALARTMSVETSAARLLALYQRLADAAPERRRVRRRIGWSR
ncbi:MAG: 1,2-diacylglycerol 3-alpha-glucosyltransferase [Thermoplasmata archaeon]|nr:1,2-diacylglycerol 3-alpha-glucosyltransferase [Thermoplasmata archaeon]